MNCEEFERALQERADGVTPGIDEAAMRRHAQGCANCRELAEGFRLVSMAFASSRVSPPSQDLTGRILCALSGERRSRLRFIRPAFWLAAAASALLAVGFWLTRNNSESSLDPRLGQHSTLATDDSRAPGELDSKHRAVSDDPLFPELATAGAVDPRDGIVLVEAVEPVSEIFRAVGRSLGNPVRPISVTATEVLGSLFKELPDADSSMMSMPGMREFMPQPMKKKMGEMRPSS